MSSFSHKGYTASVSFDPDDEIFYGHLAGIDDIVGFHASSVDELKRAFVEAVDDYIETCGRLGKSPQKPFSGEIVLRISPAIHAAAAMAAEASGQSLDKWGEEALRRAAESATA